MLDLITFSNFSCKFVNPSSPTQPKNNINLHIDGFIPEYDKTRLLVSFSYTRTVQSCTYYDVSINVNLNFGQIIGTPYTANLVETKTHNFAIPCYAAPSSYSYSGYLEYYGDAPGTYIFSYSLYIKRTKKISTADDDCKVVINNITYTFNTFTSGDYFDDDNSRFIDIYNRTSPNLNINIIRRKTTFDTAVFTYITNIDNYEDQNLYGSSLTNYNSSVNRRLYFPPNTALTNTTYSYAWFGSTKKTLTNALEDTAYFVKMPKYYKSFYDNVNQSGLLLPLTNIKPGIIKDLTFGHIYGSYIAYNYCYLCPFSITGLSTKTISKIDLDDGSFTFYTYLNLHKDTQTLTNAIKTNSIWKFEGITSTYGNWTYSGSNGWKTVDNTYICYSQAYTFTLNSAGKTRLLNNGTFNVSMKINNTTNVPVKVVLKQQNIKLGDAKVKELYLGEDKIKKVYLGSNLLYEA